MQVKKYFFVSTKKKAEVLATELTNFNIEGYVILVGQILSKEVKKVITNDKNEYALFVNEDVIVPCNIDQRVEECIEKCNSEFGNVNWAMCGNKGVDFFSKEKVFYLNEPDNRSISTGSGYPHVAQYLDSNICLLNLEAIRKSRVELGNFYESHFIAQYLLLEFTRKGLISAIDSSLYTRTHKVYKHLTNYTGKLSAIFHKYFVNCEIRTSEDDIHVSEKNYNYLQPLKQDQRQDFNLSILRNLEQAYSHKEISLNIIVRTTFRHLGQIRRLLDTIRIGQGNINSNLMVKVYLGINNPQKNNWKEIAELLKTEYKDIDMIAIHKDGFGKRKNRVGMISKAIDKIEISDKEFVWILDDDDFAMIDVFRYGHMILNKNVVTLGDSVVFSEGWDVNEKESVPIQSIQKLRYHSVNYYSTLLGDNLIPVCSAIYPIKVIKQVFEEFELLGDYSEDYTIFLLSTRFADIRPTKYLFAGISHHGSNTVAESRQSNWDYSYATFFSEISNRQVFPRIVSDYVKSGNASTQINDIQFEIFERELVYYAWVVLKKFNINKKHIQPIINSLALASKGIKKLSRSLKRKTS